jgi:hypothetical protein
LPFQQVRDGHGRECCLFQLTGAHVFRFSTLVHPRLVATEEVREGMTHGSHPVRGYEVDLDPDRRT